MNERNVIHMKVRGIEQMRRWIGFLVGVVLFLSSLPLTSMMLLELVHSQRMDMRYTIKNIGEGYPPTPSTYMYHGQMISIEETPREMEGYTDAWDNEMAFFDLAFIVNGQEVDRFGESVGCRGYASISVIQ